MSSLTGDDTTDALVPIAQRFVGAVREFDTDLMDELLAEVIDTTGGRCDPAVAMAVTLAAMVPDDGTPSGLLNWVPAAVEYDRLTRQMGVAAGIAKQLTDEKEAA